MTLTQGCLLRISRCRWSICHYIERINNPPSEFYHVDFAKEVLKKERVRLQILYDELDALTGIKNERIKI